MISRIIIIFCFFAFLGAEQNKETIKNLYNEIILPSEKSWVKNGKLEVQITLPIKTIAPLANNLPVLIWLRNPTEQSILLQINKCDAFTPHGEIKIFNSVGENIIIMECNKIHKRMAVVVPPGKTRSFRCDAFRQACTRRRKGDLPLGDYIVEYKGSKQSISVVKESYK